MSMLAVSIALILGAIVIIGAMMFFQWDYDNYIAQINLSDKDHES